MAMVLSLQAMMPAMAALPNWMIESELSSDYQYMRILGDREYQYKQADYIDNDSQSGLYNIEQFHQDLIKSTPDVIDNIQYIPIAVGDINLVFPHYPLHKRIGNSFVQSRYIRAQIFSLLNRSMINPAEFGNESQQLLKLYSNALIFAKAKNQFGQPKFHFGQNLSDADVTIDMIWPELRTIHGEQVLVPVVHLTQATIDERKVDNHAFELNSASLKSLTLNGTNLKLQRNAFLEVADNLTNNGGTIHSDGDLDILAGGTFTNLSGRVHSEGDLRIGAHNIVNKTIVHRYDYGFDQGERFGPIASISANGDVYFRATNNIIIKGAEVSAGESLTFKADGSIWIGSQQISTTTSGEENGWNYTTNVLTQLQSRLSANDAIQLVANGEIVIDAAELTTPGHIELLASLGITIDNDFNQYQDQRSGKFGKTKKDVSEYKTQAVRALLDAGRHVRIHSEFGDITLRGSDIRSQHGTQISATNGGIHLLMAKEQDHYNYFSIRESLLKIRTESIGHEIETAVYPSFIGGMTAQALYGLNIEYEGDPNLSFDEQIEVLSKMQGMEWMAEVKDELTDAQWNEVTLAYEEWHEKTSSLSPAAMAIIAIAVAVAMGPGAGLIGSAGGGTIGGLAGTNAVLGAAMNAAALSLTTTAVTSLANGEGIGGALESLVQEDTLRSAAVSMATAGAMQSLEGFDLFKQVGDGFAYSEQVSQALMSSAVNAGANTIANGGSLSDFGDAFVMGLANSAINQIGSELAGEIGGANLDDATRYIAHAALGCVRGIATAGLNDSNEGTGCYSGAGGAVVGELVAEYYKENYAKPELEENIKALTENLKTKHLTEQQLQKLLDEVIDTGVDISRLSAGFTAFLLGGDVNIAASSAEAAARFNANNRDDWEWYVEEYLLYLERSVEVQTFKTIGDKQSEVGMFIEENREKAWALIKENDPELFEQLVSVIDSVNEFKRDAYGEELDAAILYIIQSPAGEKSIVLWNQLGEDTKQAIQAYGSMLGLQAGASLLKELLGVYDSASSAQGKIEYLEELANQRKSSNGNDDRQETPERPEGWDDFDPELDAEFNNILDAFNGGDTYLDKDFKGGEGQLFFSDELPGFALKRWFSNRADIFNESVDLLDKTRELINSNPEMSSLLDVVKVHQRGKDWIIRDFDVESMELKKVLEINSSAKFAYDELLKITAKSNDPLTQKIHTKLTRKGRPSANIHWSDEQNKILIIDMM